MILRKCPQCQYLTPWSTYKVTNKSISNLSKGIPSSVIERLRRILDQEYVENEKFIDALIETIGNEDSISFKAIILKNAQWKREKCINCDMNLKLIDTDPFPSAKFAKIRDILRIGPRGLPCGLDYEMGFVNKSYKVGPLEKGFGKQLASLDTRVFKKGNRYGRDLVTLAEEIPHSVMVLYDGFNTIRGYLDLFFFEPNTFCERDLLESKIASGNLPEASDILNSKHLIKNKRYLKGKVVDIYIDALCADVGQHRHDYAHSLFVKSVHMLCTDEIYNSVRVNQVVTVAVENEEPKILLPKGKQQLLIDPGDYYAQLIAGMEQRTDGNDPKYKWGRTLYTSKFEKSWLKLSAHGIILATRFLKPFLSYVDAGDKLAGKLDEILMKN